MMFLLYFGLNDGSWFLASFYHLLFIFIYFSLDETQCEGFGFRRCSAIKFRFKKELGTLGGWCQRGALFPTVLHSRQNKNDWRQCNTTWMMNKPQFHGAKTKFHAAKMEISTFLHSPADSPLSDFNYEILDERRFPRLIMNAKGWKYANWSTQRRAFFEFRSFGEKSAEFKSLRFSFSSLTFMQNNSFSDVSSLFYSTKKQNKPKM